MDIEPYEMEQLRQAREDRLLAMRPECMDCGHPVATEECLKVEPGVYLCWNCVNDRRRFTEEEFEPEEP